MKKNKISEQLGHAFAYVQDTVDRAITFGFKKLKNVGNKKSLDNNNVHPAKKTLQNVAGFLGDMGTSYYKKYEEIKQTRSQESTSANKQK